MAEWRAIRVSVCTDYRLAVLDECAQLLYDRLILQSDNFGRQSGELLSVKLRCMPASRREPESFGEILSALHYAEMVRWYSEQGVKVVQVIGWDEMQGKYGIKDRTKSAFPQETENSIILARREPERTGENRRESLPTVQDSTVQDSTNTYTSGSPAVVASVEGDVPALLPLEVKAGKRKKIEHDFATRANIFECWRQTFKHSATSMKAGDKRDKAIQKALRDYTPDQLMDCIEGYAKDPWWSEDIARHDITVILRDSTKIDKGRDLFDHGVPVQRKIDTHHCGLKAEVIDFKRERREGESVEQWQQRLWEMDNASGRAATN